MRLFAFLLILLSTSINFSYSYDSNWNCTKLSSNKSKCTNTAGDMKLQYIGAVKNNAPNGYGILDVLNREISSEGIWSTEPGEIIPIQVSGTRNLWGTKIFINDKEFYKIVYPEGDIFEGSRSKKMNSGKRSPMITGTLKYNYGNVFKGTLKHYINPIPLSGTLYYSQGAQKGDIFTGTFHDPSPTILPKKGKYIFSKNNDKWEYYEGSSDLKGKYIFGTLKFRNGDKYVGSFKNQQYLKGKYYYVDGSTSSLNNGNISETQTSKNFKAKAAVTKAKKGFNFYWLLVFLIIIIFFIYKFNDDKYEKKHNKRKQTFIEQIKGFMNTPIGTGIMFLVIGIFLFNVFNWASTDLEPGAPKFFGHDGG